ncbi:MAG: pyridoxal phosphate-dependent aminotransferase [Desulfobacterales bacterium]|nr:pyridoxal phosphate-dependent aminotransferase [Desulfobacterales bacterium]
MPELSSAARRVYGEAAFEVLGRARALEAQGRKVLHFEIGEPDMETPDHIAEAGIQAIRNKQTHYVSPAGMDELRQAVADEVHRTRGFLPDTDQVIITPGLKPAIFFSMVAAIDPGDEIIIPDPSYPTYGSVTAMVNAVHVPVPLREENEFRLDPDDVAARITDKTKLLILNSPQNPTGSVMTRDELAAISALAEKHDFFVLSDEIYSKMIYDAPLGTGIAPSITVHDQARERSLLLDGFSKIYAMTGWRLGYMVVPKSMAQRMWDYMVSAVSCTAAFTQWAGVEALNGDQGHIPPMMERFAAKRDRMVDGLNQIPGFSCTMPRGAFYAFPNIKETGMTSQACAEYILDKAGVAVVPGTAFGKFGEGYLRFSYATDLETIDLAVEKLKAAFK